MTPNKKSEAGRQKRILIIDDHPMMREGLIQLVKKEPDLVVCGEAGDAQEGLKKIEVCKPDLVLTDVTFPGKSGLELLKDIQIMHPGLLVLVISMHDESFYAERVLRAGGRGYIMKQENGKKLMEAIRHVLSGKIYLSEKMSARIVELFSTGRNEAGKSAVETLTDREFELFQLIGRGLNTSQMANHLHVSPKTIEVHRANIKAKFKLKTAAELLLYAVRWEESGRSC
jgi:DNA-binding NarL/FixJ family response regulator